MQHTDDYAGCPDRASETELAAEVGERLRMEP
jgi:hypothetical protein